MITTLLVNVAGIALIAWIVWHFFFSRRSEVAVATFAGGGQEIQILIKGGYRPDVVRAEPHVPLRLHFRREETSACSEEIVFPDFGVKRTLPAFETTTIELPPTAPGRYGFACGMDMMHGTLVVGGAVAPAHGGAPGTVDDTDRKASCCHDPGDKD